MLLDLTVLQGVLQVGKGIKSQGVSKSMVVVQTIMLDQNEDEDDPLKSFKEHHWIFAQS